MEISKNLTFTLQKLHREKKPQECEGKEDVKENSGRNETSRNSSKTILRLQRKVLQQVSYLIHKHCVIYNGSIPSEQGVSK